MRSNGISWLLFTLLLTATAQWSCDDSDGDGDADGDADTDESADADADEDADSDADTDVDEVADADEDRDGESDSDAEADADDDRDEAPDADTDDDRDEAPDADADDDRDEAPDADGDGDIPLAAVLGGETWHSGGETCDAYSLTAESSTAGRIDVSLLQVPMELIEGTCSGHSVVAALSSSNIDLDFSGSLSSSCWTSCWDFTVTITGVPARTYTIRYGGLSDDVTVE